MKAKLYGLAALAVCVGGIWLSCWSIGSDALRGWQSIAMFFTSVVIAIVVLVTFMELREKAKK